MNPSLSPSTRSTDSTPSTVYVPIDPNLDESDSPSFISPQDYVPMFPNPNLRPRDSLFTRNPKKEIHRSNFTLDLLIGTGHFGKVFKGMATGLSYPNSKTCVAIKTTNDPSKEDEIRSLLAEAKILSNLDVHLNLVNLLGFCTSKFAYSGELWLLLEYCNEGDLKSYLQKIRRDYIQRNTGKGSFKLYLFVKNIL